MSAGAAYDLDDSLPDLGRQLAQLLVGEGGQPLGKLDGIEKHCS